MPITLADVEAEMMNRTEDFLRHYLLRISGNHGYSGETDAWFIDWGRQATGFTTGWSGRLGTTHQRDEIGFEVQLNQPVLYAGGGQQRVWYVRMQEMNQTAVDTHFCLPRVGGPDLMLTSMLSGCSFGVGNPSHGGQMVSHIRPPNALGGTQGMSADQLDPLVEAGLGSGTRALFSRTTQTGYTDQASIIGVRRNGDWGFYAQTIDGIVGAQSITGAWRFA